MKYSLFWKGFQSKVIFRRAQRSSLLSEPDNKPIPVSLSRNLITFIICTGSSIVVIYTSRISYSYSYSSVTMLRITLTK